MKTRSFPPPAKAFTLIEVLTVITIIGLLGALGFAGYQVALNKGAQKQTLARLNGLQLGVESYKLDNGEYPESIGGEKTTTVKGQAYNVGGAIMLYQVVTGDGDSAIKGGGVPSIGTPGSTGKIYWDEISPPTKKDIEKKKSKPAVAVSEDESYFVIDGWRKPFQYIKSLKDRNKRISNIDLVHSDADYEIWSYGKLEGPLEDPESQKEWIASWGTN